MTLKTYIETYLPSSNQSQAGSSKSSMSNNPANTGEDSTTESGSKRPRDGPNHGRDGPRKSYVFGPEMFHSPTASGRSIQGDLSVPPLVTEVSCCLITLMSSSPKPTVCPISHRILLISSNHIHTDPLCQPC